MLKLGEVDNICTASLVSGIIAFILGNISFIPGIHMLAYPGFTAGVLGIVLALVSLRRCKRNHHHVGRSVWGAILAILALLLSLVSFLENQSY